MNAYEQKKTTRIDRLRARADRRDSEAVAAQAAVRRIGDNIPLGQPVLLGHHSQRRHERDLARMNASMRKSIDATQEAEELRRRADGAEESTAVSSDDPEAVEKLRAKLAELERQFDILKVVNRRLRAGESVESAARPIDWRNDPASWVESWRSLGHKTIPTTNPSAEIRRVKARIVELVGRASEPTGYPEAINGVRIEERENRVRIHFGGKPGDEVRKLLKSRGFRWSPTVGAWQRHASTQAWFAARECARCATESDAP